MVTERVILLRIQNLKQRRRWITAEIASKLVDLIQDKHRIIGPGLLRVPWITRPGRAPT